MAIYTRTGDEGFTGGPDGERMGKSDPRVELLGSVDELNAVIGWCLAAAHGDPQESVRIALEPLQGELLTIGATLAATGRAERGDLTLDKTPVERMEHQIDDAWEAAGELNHFILPGGCELGARLHVARTVCRRTERTLVRAAEVETRFPPIVLQYLNRLSDLLFALARRANCTEGVPERTWERG